MDMEDAEYSGEENVTGPESPEPEAMDQTVDTDGEGPSDLGGTDNNEVMETGSVSDSSPEAMVPGSPYSEQGERHSNSDASESEEKEDVVERTVMTEAATPPGSPGQYSEDEGSSEGPITPGGSPGRPDDQEKQGSTTGPQTPAGSPYPEGKQSPIGSPGPQEPQSLEISSPEMPESPEGSPNQQETFQSPTREDEPQSPADSPNPDEFQSPVGFAEPHSLVDEPSLDELAERKAELQDELNSPPGPNSSFEETFHTANEPRTPFLDESGDFDDRCADDDARTPTGRDGHRDREGSLSSPLDFVSSDERPMKNEEHPSDNQEQKILSKEEENIKSEGISKEKEDSSSSSESDKKLRLAKDKIAKVDNTNGEAPQRQHSRSNSKEAEKKVNGKIDDKLNLSLSKGLHHDDHGELDYDEEVHEEDVEKTKEREHEEGEEIDEDKKEESEEDEGEISEDGSEEGEIKEPGNNKKPYVKPLCRFFNRGHCTWGSNCRFLHPGVNDKGNYSLIERPGMPGQRVPGGSQGSRDPGWQEPREIEEAPLPPPPPEEPVTESAWERGLRQAKELRKKASQRKETEINFEEKRLNMSLEEDKDYNKENDRSRYIAKDPYYDNLYDEEDEYHMQKTFSHQDTWQQGHYENFEVRWTRDSGPDFGYRQAGPPIARDDRDIMRERHHKHKERRHSPATMDRKYERRKEKFDDKFERPPPGSRIEKPPESVIDRAPGGARRGDEWTDPWRRSKSPKRRRESHSRSRSRGRRRRRSSSRGSSSSYSSSSSFSSRSRSRSRSSSYSSYSSRSSYSRSSSYSSKSRSRSPRPKKQGMPPGMKGEKRTVHIPPVKPGEPPKSAVAMRGNQQRSPDKKRPPAGAPMGGPGSLPPNRQPMGGIPPPGKGPLLTSKGSQPPGRGPSAGKGPLPAGKGLLSGKGGPPAKGPQAIGKGVPPIGKGPPTVKGVAPSGKGAPLPSKGAQPSGKGALPPGKGAPVPGKNVPPPGKGAAPANKGAPSGPPVRPPPGRGLPQTLETRGRKPKNLRSRKRSPSGSSSGSSRSRSRSFSSSSSSRSRSRSASVSSVSSISSSSSSSSSGSADSEHLYRNIASGRASSPESSEKPPRVKKIKGKARPTESPKATREAFRNKERLRRQSEIDQVKPSRVEKRAPAPPPGVRPRMEVPDMRMRSSAVRAQPSLPSQPKVLKQDPLKVSGQKSNIKLTLISKSGDKGAGANRAAGPNANSNRKRPAPELTSPPSSKRPAKPIPEPKPAAKPLPSKPDRPTKPVVAKARPEPAKAPVTIAKKVEPTPPPKPIPKPAPPAPAPAKKKSTSSRREELLKQLKAVEDAIARKRAKMQ